MKFLQVTMCAAILGTAANAVDVQSKEGYQVDANYKNALEFHRSVKPLGDSIRKRGDVAVEFCKKYHIKGCDEINKNIKYNLNRLAVLIDQFVSVIYHANDATTGKPTVPAGPHDPRSAPSGPPNKPQAKPTGHPKLPPFIPGGPHPRSVPTGAPKVPQPKPTIKVQHR